MLPPDQYRAIHAMYYAGVLDTQGEATTYLRYLKKAKNVLPVDDLTSFAKAQHFNPNTVIACADRIVSDYHRSQKELWLLAKEQPGPDSPLQIVSCLGYSALSSRATDWDQMLEIYVRAFASQVVTSYHGQICLAPDGVPVSLTTNFNGSTQLTLIPKISLSIYHATSVQAKADEYGNLDPSISWITPITIPEIVRYHPVHALLQIETTAHAIAVYLDDYTKVAVAAVETGIVRTLDVHDVYEFLRQLDDPDLTASLQEPLRRFKKK